MYDIIKEENAGCRATAKGDKDMKRKIVADSSANQRTGSFHGIDFVSVPLKIVTKGREFVDNEHLVVADMLDYIESHGDVATTSCPNVSDWLDAFGDADEVFVVTISSGLSGAYSAARIAMADFQERYPDKQIHIFDSLATGPTMLLMMEKLEEMITQGHPFEKIVEDVTTYRDHVDILFSLESYTNLSRGGRVSPAIAAIAAMLGIHVLGTASNEGTIQIVKKSKGSKKALQAIVSEMMAHGYRGGRVDIVDCMNTVATSKLVELIRLTFPESQISIGPCTGLCSFYAERGGLIISFEK